MKLMVWFGLMVGSTLGSWLGAWLTGNNWFSLLSIGLGVMGAIAGIWLGYTIAKNYLES